MATTLFQHLAELARQAGRRSVTLRAYRFVHEHWRRHVTRPGRFLIMATSGTAIAGSFPEVMAGAFAFSFFIALLLLAALAALLYRPKVKLTRTVPPRCVAGSDVECSFTLHNPTRRPLADVGVHEFSLPLELSFPHDTPYLAQLPPGATHTFTTPLRVARRGIYQLPGPSALSSFPFGLMQSCRWFRQPTRLVVYPQFTQLHTLRLPVSPRYQPGGIVLTSQVGESMEFVGNREYQPGDRLRDLHPRSWARVGYPVVRQYQEEFLCRIAILVDTYLPPPAGPWWRRLLDYRHPVGAELEANLSLAAAIADHLARREYVVDLFAAGPELYHFQAGRSLAYLDNILDILACLEPCRSDPLQNLTPRFSGELAQISTAVLLLMHWDEARRQLVEQVRAAGVEVKVIIVSDQVDAGQVSLGMADVQCFTPAQVRGGVAAL